MHGTAIIVESPGSMTFKTCSSCTAPIDIKGDGSACEYCGTFVKATETGNREEFSQKDLESFLQVAKDSEERGLISKALAQIEAIGIALKGESSQREVDVFTDIYRLRLKCFLDESYSLDNGAVTSDILFKLKFKEFLLDKRFVYNRLDDYPLDLIREASSHSRELQGQFSPSLFDRVADEYKLLLSSYISDFSAWIRSILPVNMELWQLSYSLYAQVYSLLIKMCTSSSLSLEKRNDWSPTLLAMMEEDLCAPLDHSVQSEFMGKTIVREYIFRVDGCTMKKFNQVKKREILERFEFIPDRHVKEFQKLYPSFKKNLSESQIAGSHELDEYQIIYISEQLLGSGGIKEVLVDQKSLQVTIPRGTKIHSKLRLKGYGKKLMRGGQLVRRGDLYLTIELAGGNTKPSNSRFATELFANTQNIRVAAFVAIVVFSIIFAVAISSG